MKISWQNNQKSDHRWILRKNPKFLTTENAYRKIDHLYKIQTKISKIYSVASHIAWFPIKIKLLIQEHIIIIKRQQHNIIIMINLIKYYNIVKRRCRWICMMAMTQINSKIILKIRFLSRVLHKRQNRTHQLMKTQRCKILHRMMFLREYNRDLLSRILMLFMRSPPSSAPRDPWPHRKPTKTSRKTCASMSTEIPKIGGCKNKNLKIRQIRRIFSIWIWRLNWLIHIRIIWHIRIQE